MGGGHGKPAAQVQRRFYLSQRSDTIRNFPGQLALPVRVRGDLVCGPRESEKPDFGSSGSVERWRKASKRLQLVGFCTLEVLWKVWVLPPSAHHWGSSDIGEQKLSVPLATAAPAGSAAAKFQGGW